MLPNSMGTESMHVWRFLWVQKRSVLKMNTAA